MKRISFLTLATLLYLAISSQAIILIKINGIQTGDSRFPSFPASEGWFVADSFSFGVERDLNEAGKGGTEDLNIGIGELQECTISKSMDRASAFLAQYAITGKALGPAEIHFVQSATINGRNKHVSYLIYKLDRCFVKSWSTSGDADDRPTEDVAFYYNKIAFQYFSTSDGKTFQNGGTMGWDNVTYQPWSAHQLPTTAPIVDAD